jgi:hypothetical protein
MAKVYTPAREKRGRVLRILPRMVNKGRCAEFDAVHGRVSLGTMKRDKQDQTIATSAMTGRVAKFDNDGPALEFLLSQAYGATGILAVLDEVVVEYFTMNDDDNMFMYDNFNDALEAAKNVGYDTILKVRESTNLHTGHLTRTIAGEYARPAQCWHKEGRKTYNYADHNEERFARKQRWEDRWNEHLERTREERLAAQKVAA